MSRVLFVIYDNESYTHLLPLGPAYMAAVLRKAGHDVAIWDRAANRRPAGSLTRHLDAEHYDAVGCGIIGGYSQHAELLKISEEVNASKRRGDFAYILGGHGPTPAPDYFLRRTGADAVALGEAEEIMHDVANKGCVPMPGLHLAPHKFQSKSQEKRVKLQLAGQRPEHGNCGKREPPADLDALPWPAYDLFDMSYYRMLRMPRCRTEDYVIPVTASRGCLFKCGFCYRIEEGLRNRSAADVAAECEYLHERYGITYIMFVDELLIMSRERAYEIADVMRPLHERTGMRWNCQGRLNYIDQGVAKAIASAGCVFVNVGIESLDDRARAIMQKALPRKMIEPGLKALLDHGVSPGLNIIWGSEGETVASLNEAVEFLIRWDDGAQLRTIRPTTPYPGSPDYYKAISRGLLDAKDPAEDFYRRHVNSDLLAVNFTEVPDDEFHEALRLANRRLLEHHFARSRQAALDECDRLYQELNASFRGWRHSGPTGGRSTSP